MDKNVLLSDFYFLHFQYSNIHSAGPEISFYNPCIGYIKKGYAKFLYKGKTFYAYKGDLIYVATGTKYQSIWYGSPDIEWYSVNFDFSSKYAFYGYRFQILKNYPGDIFEKMHRSYEESPLMSLSYFYGLLNDIYKKLKKTPLPSSYSVIEPAVKYIENNYRESFSVKMLSSLCNISESGFFKQFKKTMGVTPVTYKHNIMIQNAIDLLSNTSMPIEEISSCVGFPSSNYFRKVFFKLTEKKPKDLRRK